MANKIMEGIETNKKKIKSIKINLILVGIVSLISLTLSIINLM